jgi:hypothetical protein
MQWPKQKGQKDKLRSKWDVYPSETPIFVTSGFPEWCVVFCFFAFTLLHCLLILLRFTDSDYPFGIFKLLFQLCTYTHLDFRLSKYYKDIAGTNMEPMLIFYFSDSSTFNFYKIIFCDMFIVYARLGFRNDVLSFVSLLLPCCCITPLQDKLFWFCVLSVAVKYILIST